MAKYRHGLPLTKGDRFLTDGGMETTLIFLDGVDLPHFASFVLLATPEGRRKLKDYYARYLDLARQASGCEIWQKDFLALDLPAERFDDIFANASLFHIPGAELPRVLTELRDSLKPGGVLFSSNPRGHNEEGWQGERYGVWHDWPHWRTLLTDAGFEELEHYYRPADLPRDQQPWLASVWRKQKEKARGRV